MFLLTLGSPFCAGSIVEVFIAGGRVAAVMPYQPPNDVTNVLSMDLSNYTNVHFFAEQPQDVSDVAIHAMGCGWNQTMPHLTI